MLAERAAASSAILCHCDTLVLIIRFSLFVACSAATFGRRRPSYRFGLLHLGGSSGELKSIHLVMREIVEGFSRNPQHILDRKSTRLNSSHLVISYAVFC